MDQRTMFPDDGQLNVRDYLAATDHAASRSRAAMIVLLVACLLMFAGLLNSLQHSWMRERIQALRKPGDAYACSKVGPIPDAGNFKEWGVDTLEDAQSLRKEQYLRLYSEVAEVYAKTSLTVGIPVLGASIDVNDLGLIGGAGLLFILLVCTFCLSRELENLRVAFGAAARFDQTKGFYYLLAMRQVFTIPQSPRRPRKRYLQLVPSGMYVLPPLVYGSVGIHDFITSTIGAQLGDIHTQIVLSSETALFVLVLIFSGIAWNRQRQLDQQWEEQWKSLSASVDA